MEFRDVDGTACGECVVELDFILGVLEVSSRVTECFSIGRKGLCGHD